MMGQHARQKGGPKDVHVLLSTTLDVSSYMAKGDLADVVKDLEMKILPWIIW